MVLMATDGFVIKRTSDENMEITLNGRDVVSLNHDSDGWEGMGRGEDIVRTIASILNLPVTEE
jgi:hypothetical protein